MKRFVSAVIHHLYQTTMLNNLRTNLSDTNDNP